MSYELLQIITYLLLGCTVVFYVILDGFDLGVGCLQIFAGKDRDRRMFLNSIGPLWDGNEVWLISIVGVLLVGFPAVYAALLSGFYSLIMVMLFGIILRAVAIEFRSKKPQLVWRYFWDTVFAVSSIIITFAAGVLLGNLLIGVPLDQTGNLRIGFFSIFSWYPNLVGFFSISLVALHGAYFLLLKTEGELQERVYNFAKRLLYIFYAMFSITTIWTWLTNAKIVKPFFSYPILVIVPLILILVLLTQPLLLKRKKYGLLFALSMFSITLLFVVALIGTFPNILPSNIDTAYNMTIFNSSSERLTLIITLIVAASGIPLVLTYGYILYRVFHGKTVLTDNSY